jgi:hypothetical protein
LNGRDIGPQYNEVYLDIPDSFVAYPKYFKWTFEKDGTQFKIKSHSSGLYIDGRDPEHVDQDGVVVLTSDEGSNTKYLLWNIEKVDGNYALKINSSGAYLDERNPDLTLNQLWLTDHPPKGDWYLQWIIEPEVVIPYGTYKIKTTVHEASGCEAKRGLSTWRENTFKPSAVRDDSSTWIAAHSEDHTNCLWMIKPRRKEGTCQIETKPRAESNHPGGWGLSSFPGIDGARCTVSARISAHGGDQMSMDWWIVAGRTKGTYQIVTTEHVEGGQTAGWGLSARGPKVPFTYCNEKSTWVHVHEGTAWPKDWILEKHDFSCGTYKIKTSVHEASGCCPAGWGLSTWREKLAIP